jgi:hypothetical protein
MMFVNCFNVTFVSKIYKSTLKKISKEFGKNIPKSSPYEGGPMGFITHLFCVDANVNIKEICIKNNCEMNELYKMEIGEHMYNNKYIILNTYSKKGEPFLLALDKSKL